MNALLFHAFINGNLCIETDVLHIPHSEQTI